MKTNKNVAAGIMLIAGSVIGAVGAVLRMFSAQITVDGMNLIALPLSFAVSILLAVYMFGAFPGRKGYFTVPTYFTYSAVAAVVSMVTSISMYVTVIGRGVGYSLYSIIFNLTLNAFITGLKIAVAVVSFMKFRKKIYKWLLVYLTIIACISSVSTIGSSLISMTVSPTAPSGSPARLLLTASSLAAVGSVLSAAALLLFVLKLRFSSYEPLPESVNPEEELKRFAEMRDSGIISEEEYKARCADIGVAPAGQTAK